MTELNEVKPLTSLEYWYLQMADRAFERMMPSDMKCYEFAKSIHRYAKQYSLEFAEDFQIGFGALNQIEKNQSRGVGDGGVRDDDEHTKNQILKRVATVRVALKKRLESAKSEKHEKTSSEHNVDFLSDALKFTPLRKKMLTFFASRNKGGFDSLLSAVYPQSKGSVEYEDYIEGLAYLLDEDTEDVRIELEPENILMGMQFIDKEDQTSSRPHHIDPVLEKILRRRYETSEKFLHEIMGEPPSSELVREDFEYRGSEFDDMILKLQQNLDNPKIERKNMCFAGPPGTGKTERAAVLAHELNVPAFMVGIANKSEGNGYSRQEPSRDHRFKSLIRAAFILRQTGMRALLIFDESEDILRDLNRENTNETGSKAFINETLENFGVPVIFISNRTDLFDPATMRRILPIYHVNYMPYAARKKSIDKKVQTYLDITLDETEIDELAAKSEKLTIAVIDSCVRNVSKDTSETTRDSTLENLDREIHRAIVAMNHGYLPLPYENNGLPKHFNPALISASCDTPSLFTQFSKAAETSERPCAGADILLLGNNGTGRKTLATYLASAFNRPIKVIPFNEGAATQYPTIAHAGDLERADLDENILIFDGVTNFLPMAYGHPFMQRLRNHRYPSFLIGNDEPFGNELPQGLMQTFTFAIRTGTLSNEQRHIACQDILGIECDPRELSAVPDLNIGNIHTVKRQLNAFGKNGETSTEKTITFLEKLEATKKPIGHRPAGFA